MNTAPDYNDSSPTLSADQNLHEGIIRLSSEGHVQYANPAAVRILGFASTDQLLADAGLFLQNIQLVSTVSLSVMGTNLVQEDQLADLELEFIRRNDAQPAYAQYTMQRLQSFDGQHTGYQVSLIDISERRQNSTLRDALKAAQKSAAGKTDFYSNLSHEFRTPLNGISGALDLLGGTRTDQQQVRYLKVAKTSTRLLEGVITDMMDVTDIQANRLLLESEPLSFTAIVDQAMRDHAAKALNKELGYSSAVSIAVPDGLKGDAARLRQLLGLLLNNAVRYTDAGSVSLQVNCTELDDDHVTLSISIEDTGNGIADEQKHYLQELFAKNDADSTLQHGGARLGLTLCHQLSRLMGARLSVESELGTGSAFNLSVELPISQRLPLGRAPLSAASSEMRSIVYTTSTDSLPEDERVSFYRISHKELAEELSFSHGMANQQNNLAGVDDEAPRILIAEDNKINQLVASETLLGAGYRVSLADNGEEALAVVENGGIDLVLMDCQMPVLDGFETTRSIRTAERDKGVLVPRQLPIIALTANTAKGDREKCLVSGMNDYISKPFNPELLFHIIDQYVPRPAGRDAIDEILRGTGT